MVSLTSADNSVGTPTNASCSSTSTIHSSPTRQQDCLSSPSAVNLAMVLLTASHDWLTKLISRKPPDLTHSIW